MNIRTTGYAIVVLSVTFGCAGTGNTDRQKTVQGVDKVQSTETIQGTKNDSYDPDEVTCKRITKTGTRFKTRVCATNREWKTSEEFAVRATEKMQQRPQQGRDTG